MGWQDHYTAHYITAGWQDDYTLPGPSVEKRFEYGRAYSGRTSSTSSQPRDVFRYLQSARSPQRAAPVTHINHPPPTGLHNSGIHPKPSQPEWNGSFGSHSDSYKTSDTPETGKRAQSARSQRVPSARGRVAGRANPSCTTSSSSKPSPSMKPWPSMTYEVPVPATADSGNLKIRSSVRGREYGSHRSAPIGPRGLGRDNTTSTATATSGPTRLSSGRGLHNPNTSTYVKEVPHKKETFSVNREPMLVDDHHNPGPARQPYLQRCRTYRDTSGKPGQREKQSARLHDCTTDQQGVHPVPHGESGGTCEGKHVEEEEHPQPSQQGQDPDQQPGGGAGHEESPSRAQGASNDPGGVNISGGAVERNYERLYPLNYVPLFTTGRQWLGATLPQPWIHQGETFLQKKEIGHEWEERGRQDYARFMEQERQRQQGDWCRSERPQSAQSAQTLKNPKIEKSAKSAGSAANLRDTEYAKSRKQREEEWEVQWEMFRAGAHFSRVLKCSDIPFPPTDVSVAALSGITTMDDAKQLKAKLRQSLLRWHPDKFMETYGKCLVDETERTKALSHVNTIATQLTAEVQRTRHL